MSERKETIGLGHPEGSRRAVPRAEAALIERVPRGARVLDIGCGRGYGLERFSGYGLETIGLEIGKETLREAKQRGPVVEGTADRLPFQEASFDAAVIIQVFHHVDDPPACIAEVRRILRPGGLFMLWETTETSPLVRAGRTLRPNWDGVPVRARFTTEQLRHWLRDGGFSLGEELRWGTLLIGASALGSLAPPLKRLVAAMWSADISLGRVLPFWQGFYSCLAEKSE